MNQNKIVPNIWFNTTEGNLSTVIDYYKKIFKDEFQDGNVIPLGETPSGKAEMCEIKIFGQNYSFISTANEHQPLNDAISFIIKCCIRMR